MRAAPALEAALEAALDRLGPRGGRPGPGPMSPSRRRPSLALRVVVGAVGLAGVALLARGAWVPAKALVAQVLLARAWERAGDGGAAPRPWPWADTRPVGRLHLPDGTTLVVLAGANGRTLAFGPGHLDGTARPGEAGNVVLAGHRDSHFRALERLARGDLLRLEGPGGAHRLYRVERLAVVDRGDTRALVPDGPSRLTLVTCWPFGAVRPGGPWRYVVVAAEAGGVNAAAAGRSRSPAPRLP